MLVHKQACSQGEIVQHPGGSSHSPIRKRPRSPDRADAHDGASQRDGSRDIVRLPQTPTEHPVCAMETDPITALSNVPASRRELFLRGPLDLSDAKANPPSKSQPAAVTVSLRGTDVALRPHAGVPRALQCPRSTPASTAANPTKESRLAAAIRFFEAATGKRPPQACTDESMLWDPPIPDDDVDAFGGDAEGGMEGGAERSAQRGTEGVQSEESGSQPSVGRPVILGVYPPLSRLCYRWHSKLLARSPGILSVHGARVNAQEFTSQAYVSHRGCCGLSAA
eukprot:1809258-Pyramimonas_sp.AAC.1